MEATRLAKWSKLQDFLKHGVSSIATFIYDVTLTIANTSFQHKLNKPLAISQETLDLSPSKIPSAKYIKWSWLSTLASMIEVTVSYKPSPQPTPVSFPLYYPEFRNRDFLCAEHASATLPTLCLSLHLLADFNIDLEELCDAAIEAYGFALVEVGLTVRGVDAFL